MRNSLPKPLEKAHFLPIYCVPQYIGAGGALMATEDFKLLQKVQDMMVYGYPLLNNFPKVVKFSLAQDIRNSMNEILVLTITEDKKSSKRTTLEYLDVENEKLKYLLRISMELKYLSMHHYAVWEAKLVEIGRMIGGLLKSVSNKPKT